MFRYWSVKELFNFYLPLSKIDERRCTSYAPTYLQHDLHFPSPLLLKCKDPSMDDPQQIWWKFLVKAMSIKTLNDPCILVRTFLAWMVVLILNAKLWTIWIFYFIILVERHFKGYNFKHFITSSRAQLIYQTITHP